MTFSEGGGSGNFSYRLAFFAGLFTVIKNTFNVCIIRYIFLFEFLFFPQGLEGVQVPLLRTPMINARSTRRLHQA